jgi:flagellar M-ring protein FliF
MAATDLSAALPQGLREARSLKDIPVLRQLGMMLVLSIAIAGGIAMFFWTQKPNFAPLYTGLADVDAAQVADALRASGIEYKLEPGTGAVTVPGDKVYEARMKLASQGLPKGSAQGMEMLGKEQGFGTSQFIENARYQLAQETELARSIGTLTTIKAARVHLALPKPSAFTRNNDHASASVIIELYPGRSLDQGQVASIVHMVASSVPNLAPTNVTVIDQYGRLLTQDDPNSEAAQSAEQFDYTRRVEGDYVRRIEQLLTPMMGPGRISAQVAADLDFSVTEEAHEAYNPNPQAIRSEQTSEDVSRNGANPPAQGVPGATSNQPPSNAQAVPVNNAAAVAAAGQTPAAGAPGAPATATAAATEAPTSQTKTSTRNYEIDKTISHTRQSVGRVRRLSIAVLVDQIPKANDKGELVPTALTADELAKVQALVREAVGFDDKRGDTVAVQNAPFLQSEAIKPPPALPIWQQPEVRDYARQGLGALVLLVLGFFVLRPMIKGLMAPPAPKTVEGILETMAERRSVVGGTSLGDDRVSLGVDNEVPKIYEQKLVIARQAVAQDPKRVAQVVKTWIGSES